MSDKSMWEHECPIDGKISVGKGESCNWCGAAEPKTHLRLIKNSGGTDEIDSNQN